MLSVHIVVYVLNILLLLALAWVSLYVTIFIYEFGHVQMYRIIFHDKKWRIIIGTGKPSLKQKGLT